MSPLCDLDDSGNMIQSLFVQGHVVLLCLFVDHDHVTVMANVDR